NTAKMEVSPETKLSKQLAFSYQSFSSPQVEDGLSSNDLVKKHGERKSVNILFSQSAGCCCICLLLASINGVLVSDHERCTALGQRVLQDGGSSVDAAVAGALCLGVVHPHVSGVGGGGVMLVHDIHKNQTRVINFQGTAPKTFRKEMLHNVSGLKAGLQVGVPGMLKGLQHAHSLYVFWSNIQTISFFSLKSIILPENDKPGFHLSSSIADAISKVEGEQLSQRFRDIFIPEGRALQAGSYVRIPGLAGVLEAGLSNFYYGNLSQEIEDEVRANGGVLSRDDISNYSVESVTFVLDYIIQVPPPPSAGAALISALNILSENNITENKTHPWIAEVPDCKISVYYHLSLNRPFGSRIITRSGIILNSLLLDYLWSNKTQRHADSEERPLLLLMPTIMVPAGRKCGIYTALSSSGGQNVLHTITQTICVLKVLTSALLLDKEKKDSLILGGVQPQPNRLLVDSASPEESVQFIHAEGHVVQRGKTNSAVQGIQRRENIIKVIKV
uniref:Gamma-glutamyltransferase 7 n=1 Tax=Amphiprion ocellaris TaxID=80972 RepID=A0A3Q1C5V5_AMPOC